MKITCKSCGCEYTPRDNALHEASGITFSVCPMCGTTNLVKGPKEEEQPLTPKEEIKEEERVRIWEFDNPVYSRKLWVVVDAPMEVLWDLFGKEDLPEWPETGAARATRVCREKPDTKGGVLLEFKKEWITLNTIAHECAHVAWYIADYCNLEVDIDHTEQFAYLVGWAAECVDKAINGGEVEKDKVIEYTLPNEAKV